MYKNILLLLDCSSVDKKIIVHVADLASILHSHVHLFHVVHAHTLDQERVLSAKAEQSISEALQYFKEKGINSDFSIGEGEPSAEVLKIATEERWDLIALATHGHKAFGDFIYGSVSNTLKHKSGKPLLFINGK